MQFITFRPQRAAQPRVGVVDGDVVHTGSAALRMLKLLDDGNLFDAGQAIVDNPTASWPLRSVHLDAPVPRPPSVRDFYAFEEHATNARRARGIDLDPDWFQLPVFYFSNPAAVCGPNDPVEISPGSTMWDYELEVAAVIGTAGRDLDPISAHEHIAGFSVLCDFSARDLQAREVKLGLGPAKGKDGATSFGPALVTPDELADRFDGQRYHLAMTATVNGQQWSEGNLASMHWSFGQLLAYASRGATLQPGDVIGTGTVGTGCILELQALHGADGYPWLAPGDVVELSVERLGVVRHEIQPGIPVRPLGQPAGAA